MPYVTDGIRDVVNSTNAKVYVFGRKDMLNGSIDIINTYQSLDGVEKFATKYKKQEVDRVNSILSSMSGIIFINLYSYLCDSPDSCKVLTDNKKPILYDGSHLTKFGAIYLGERVGDALK